MNNSHPVKLGEVFSPSTQLRALFYWYFVGVLILVVFPWLIPLTVKGDSEAFIPLSIFFLPTFLFTLYWLPLFYKSISYQLTNDEMIWKRGVWFKHTGVVPYNRITNIDIAQGPLERMLGIGTLKIQTAGYSVQGSSSEIKIMGMENFEALHEMIMGYVRSRKPVAIAAGEETDSEMEFSTMDVNGQMLLELQKIRQLLEKNES